MLDSEVLYFENYASCQYISENIIRASIEAQPFELQTLLLVSYFSCHAYGSYPSPHYTLTPFMRSGRSTRNNQGSSFCDLLHFIPLATSTYSS